MLSWIYPKQQTENSHVIVEMLSFQSYFKYSKLVEVRKNEEAYH